MNFKKAEEIEKERKTERDREEKKEILRSCRVDVIKARKRNSTHVAYYTAL